MNEICDKVCPNFIGQDFVTFLSFFRAGVSRKITFEMYWTFRPYLENISFFIHNLSFERNI